MCVRIRTHEIQSTVLCVVLMYRGPVVCVRDQSVNGVSSSWELSRRQRIHNPKYGDGWLRSGLPMMHRIAFRALAPISKRSKKKEKKKHVASVSGLTNATVGPFGRGGKKPCQERGLLALANHALMKSVSLLSFFSSIQSCQPRASVVRVGLFPKNRWLS